MRQRQETTHVWVRTDAVEAVLRNGGQSLPNGWKPSRKRGRSTNGDVALSWGWARARVVQSLSKGNETNNNTSPFGEVKLRKVGSPSSLWNSPEKQSSRSNSGPITLTIEDPEFAPTQLQNVTVTLFKTVGDEPVVHMANSWWHTPTCMQNDVDTAPDDLTTLVHLHEPAVVYCLKRRYEQDSIYTYTGKILLALNPFRVCRHLYGAQVMKQYCLDGDEVERPPPHIYAIAQDAYGTMIRAMQMKRSDINTNQSILVSGESGAGKTVTTKIIMRYLATLSRSQIDNEEIGIREDDCSIESQVLQSNPILESFGNARTVRNDNSSRFGKFIEIQFLDSGCLMCASIETYLLEKVRLITQAPGERNYHIFYELLAGASLKEKRILQIANSTPRDFQMTLCSGTYDRRDGVEDRSTYRDLIKALDTVGFSRKEQMELFTVACALLHASNLTFVETGSDASGLDQTGRSLQSTLSLMGVTADALNDALCTCAIEARGETLFKNMTLPQAAKALEALIKATYGALFTHIVRRINNSITVRRELDTAEDRTSSTAYIGVLDIFGFESFDTNSFEQLCINYCNEALQQQFNRFVFKLEQEEYEKEGIEWSFVTFPDNQDVLDVIEKKRTGILSILDEQCRLPRSTDGSFARATYDICSSHPRFDASHTQQVALVFSVHHYAGPVEYDTANFLEKNKDELPKETTDLLISSSHPLLPTLGNILRTRSVTSGDTSNRKQLKRMSSSLMRESVGSQFSRQLSELRDRIDDTTPHYVRCLKPNDELVPKNFHPLVIADQLRCAGVLEAIRVSRVGFPQRFAHDAFVQRYRILAARDLRWAARYQNDRDLCELLVDAVAVQVAGVVEAENSSPPKLSERQRAVVDPASVGIQMGRTKVFLRRRAFDSIEIVRTRKINAAATAIQSGARMFIAKTWFDISIMAALILQSFGRRLSALRKVRVRRHLRSAVRIQCAWRRRTARAYFSAVRLIVTWCQSSYRGGIAREIYAFLLLERKALIIQRSWRRHICFSRFHRVGRLTVTLQCLIRGKLARLVLKRLKREARDLDVISAERDRFRAESARLRRELETAMRRESIDSTRQANVSVLSADSPELERLRREVERLKNERMVPPTCSFVIPADASDNVEELQSLASECAQKDRELQLLRQELASLRSGTQTDSKTYGTKQSVTLEPEVVSTSRLNKDPLESKVVGNARPNKSPVEEATKRQAPSMKGTRASGITSPIKSLFGSVCRGVEPNTTVGESPSRSDMPSSARSLTSTSLLDDEEDHFDVGEYGAHMDGSPMAKHMEKSSSLIEETWSHDDHAPFVLSGGNEVGKELLLHRAASDGDESTLRAILTQNSPNVQIEINEGDFNGRTPLHLAVLSSNVGIASLLLENGAVANSQDHEGCTPLHLATDASLTALLLDKGHANPNIPNLDGVCALHLAVRRGDVESIEHILRYRPDINAADNFGWFTPLHLVAQSEIEFLRGSFESSQSREQVKSTRRLIADMLCAVTDPIEPDLNYQDSDGNTPLHHAAMLTTRDAGDLFSLFLDKGGDPNIINQKGQTILHLLCRNDALRELNVIHEVLHLVLFHGADPNLQSLTGCTALHLSLYHHDIDAAIQLMDSGAELHLGWKKPANWAWVWDDLGSSEVLALDMVQDEHSLHRILAAISKPQKWAPPRPCCMQCKAILGTFSRSLHCRHCGRSVCGTCSHRRLGADLFPKSFGIQESSWVCIVCEKILVTRQEENGSETQPNSSIQEDSEEDRALFLNMVADVEKHEELR